MISPGFRGGSRRVRSVLLAAVATAIVGVGANATRVEAKCATAIPARSTVEGRITRLSGDDGFSTRYELIADDGQHWTVDIGLLPGDRFVEDPYPGTLPTVAQRYRVEGLRDRQLGAHFIAVNGCSGGALTDLGVVATPSSTSHVGWFVAAAGAVAVLALALALGHRRRLLVSSAVLDIPPKTSGPHG